MGLFTPSTHSFLWDTLLSAKKDRMGHPCFLNFHIRGQYHLQNPSKLLDNSCFLIFQGVKNHIPSKPFKILQNYLITLGFFRISHQAVFSQVGGYHRQHTGVMAGSQLDHPTDFTDQPLSQDLLGGMILHVLTVRADIRASDLCLLTDVNPSNCRAKCGHKPWHKHAGWTREKHPLSSRKFGRMKRQ